MPHPAYAKLRFGPYPVPRFKYGQVVTDEVHGDVQIVGLTDARIPWPIGKKGRHRVRILYGSLVSAVRRETAVAVAYWWGASPWLVKKWRRALAVPRENEGKRARRLEYARSKAGRKRLAAMHRKAHTPESHAKIAATKMGVPRPRKVAKLLRTLRLGKPHTEASRRKMSATHKRLGSYPPTAGRRWESREDAAVRKLSPAAAAKRTGRTRSAINNRRFALGVPDGRTKRQRRRLGR